MLPPSIAHFSSPPLHFLPFSLEVTKKKRNLPEEVFCSSRGHLCSVSMALKCPREELFTASTNTL